jgi:hypothetical protein
MPRFTFVEESSGIVSQRAGSGFLFLFAATLIIGVLAFVQLRRYPIAG